MNTSSKKYKPLLVGLTGGIGSGKTTVANVFMALGIPVFNSDKQAKIILQKNPDVREMVIQSFGDVYPNNVLDKAKLAEQVFNDKDKLNALNAIVHPAVGAAFNRWVGEHAQEAILMKEAAILFETATYKQLDRTILVSCPIEERINRVVKRDKVSREDVLARMENQWSDEQKRALADFEITTGGNEMIIPQVLKIVKQLKSLTS